MNSMAFVRTVVFCKTLPIICQSCLCVGRYVSRVVSRMLLACTPLSQYVNLAKTLPCLSQPPPAVRDKFIFCPFCPSSPPDQPFADPISASQVPRPRDPRLLFCGFLLRLISGLNHPLAPQIWRWGGPGVREGNDGTQSTKLEDGIWIEKYTFLELYIGHIGDAVEKVPEPVTQNLVLEVVKKYRQSTVLVK